MSAITQPDIDPEEIARDTEAAMEKISAARREIARIIFGQESVVERALVTLLSGGHALLVGVPGLAKTKLVETLGTVLGLDARRIQFTPDLMPSDILGAEVMDQAPDGSRSSASSRGRCSPSF
jgi:MoxR-like ATPase